MPTEAIACPTCGAADSSRPDGHGLHTCVYCGVRYRITGGVPTRVVVGAPVAPVPTTPPKALALVAGIFVLMGGAGAAYFLLLKGDSRPATIPVASPSVTPGAVPSTSLGSAATSTSVVAPGPSTATFELDHKRPSVGTSFYAIGWVTNASDHAIDKAKVVVVLRDAGGQEVGTGFGFTKDDAIMAGERVPVSVLVKDPPAFATIDAEVQARPSTFGRARIEGLRVEAGPVKKDSWHYVVDGKIHHDGTVPARFVQIEVRAYDSAGELLGLDETYVDAEVLAPGASARWNASPLGFEAEPVRFEFVARGVPAAQ